MLWVVMRVCREKWAVTDAYIVRGEELKNRFWESIWNVCKLSIQMKENCCRSAIIIASIIIFSIVLILTAIEYLLGIALPILLPSPRPSDLLSLLLSLSPQFDRVSLFAYLRAIGFCRMSNSTSLPR